MVLLVEDAVLFGDLLLLVVDLSLANVGELLGEHLALGYAIDKDQVYHSHV